MKIIQRIQLLAKRLLPLFGTTSVTDEQLLAEIKTLGPAPTVKILNATLDLGGHGLYKIKFFQDTAQVAQYSQSRVSLQTAHAAAALYAKLRHYDYVEIAILSSEEPNA
jgi:hypothetical protein